MIYVSKKIKNSDADKIKDDDDAVRSYEIKGGSIKWIVSSIIIIIKNHHLAKQELSAKKPRESIEIKFVPSRSWLGIFARIIKTLIFFFKK